MDRVVKHFKQDSLEKFYVNLGRGDISIAQMASLLDELIADETKQQGDGDAVKITSRSKASKLSGRSSDSSVNVLGVGNLLTTIANCCMPIPDDDITGFITKDRGC